MLEAQRIYPGPFPGYPLVFLEEPFVDLASEITQEQSQVVHCT